MATRKKIVLSEENRQLFLEVADMVEGKEEAEKDINFALSLLFNRLKERPHGTVMGALGNSLDPDMIEGARDRAARNKAA